MEFRGVLAIFAAVAAVALSISDVQHQQFADELVTYPEAARELSSRIVSGWEAEEGQLPYQMSLRMVSATGNVNGCGATIIHSEWALTAAHCTAGRVTFVLLAGMVNLTRPGVIFETTTFYNYPLYNNNLPSLVQPHDIGLIGFNRVLSFTANIQPIRIQNSASWDRDFSGVQLVASGWGRTWTNGASPENLNWVYLRGETNTRCRSLFGSIIIESTICASGYNDTTQSTCQGDSGGPLTVVDDDGHISQVGVTSFVSGAGCHADMPAGFIRPGYYHTWFTNVTGVDFDWGSEEDNWDPECDEEEVLAVQVADA